MSRRPATDSREDWTTGAAKWAAIAILGAGSIAGIVFSAHAWRARQAAERLELDARVELNAASAAELQLLPGIGPTLAERIVADRDDVGPFASVEELQRVPGIGPKTVAGLAPHARVDGTGRGIGRGASPDANRGP